MYATQRLANISKEISMFRTTSVVSRRGISALALAAALALGVLAQTSFAADEPDLRAAATPNGAVSSASVQPGSGATGMICSTPSPCMLGRTSQGWEMDLGGPAIHFEAASED